MVFFYTHYNMHSLCAYTGELHSEYQSVRIQTEIFGCKFLVRNVLSFLLALSAVSLRVIDVFRLILSACFAEVE